MARQSGSLKYVTRIDPATELEVPAEGKRKVFVSYKKSDNRLSGVRDITIRKILRLVDCAVWYDDGLTPGVNYEDEIRRAISECDAVVLLLTQDIIESSFVWDIEVATAREQEKGIIPLAFDISPDNFAIAEERLGDRLHILRWPSAAERGHVSDDAMKFDDSFARALECFLIDVDLAHRVEQFFLSGRHKSAIRYLSSDDRYLMGYGCLMGLRVEKNVERGIGLLDSVARMYSDDDETDRLREEALLVLDKHYYDRGEHARSAEYAAMGVALDCTDSIYNLGYMYRKGEGVEKDLAEAMRLLSAAAERGHVKAMYHIGIMHDNGEGVPKDKTEAVRWYRNAAELGHPGAMCNLGYMYEFGEGVEQDFGAAAQWYQKAAELGNATAMTNLGYMYDSGKGIDQDYAAAIKWYTRAAELGKPRAMVNLAYLYSNGNGVEANGAEAVKWYQKAAELGDDDAMFNLGVILRSGKGVQRDDAAAIQWYRKAVELDNSSAMVNLGYLCGEGIGVERDHEEERRLYERAAELGNTKAMYNLGIMYLNGQGVERSEAQASQWFAKAAALGHAEAREAIERMSKKPNSVGQKTISAKDKSAKTSGVAFNNDLDSLYNKIRK